MEIKHDPIEDSAAYKAISDEIDEEARKRMEMRKLQFEKEESEREEPFGVEPSWIHIFWHEKKRVLKEKYGIDWKTPSQMNPDINFD